MVTPLHSVSVWQHLKMGLWALGPFPNIAELLLINDSLISSAHFYINILLYTICFSFESCFLLDQNYSDPCFHSSWLNCGFLLSQ